MLSDHVGSLPNQRFTSQLGIDSLHEPQADMKRSFSLEKRDAMSFQGVTDSGWERAKETQKSVTLEQQIKHSHYGTYFPASPTFTSGYQAWRDARCMAGDYIWLLFWGNLNRETVHDLASTACYAEACTTFAETQNDDGR